MLSKVTSSNILTAVAVGKEGATRVFFSDSRNHHHCCILLADGKFEEAARAFEKAGDVENLLRIQIVFLKKINDV